MTWKEFNEYLDQYPEFFQEMDGEWFYLDCKDMYHWVCSYEFNTNYIPQKIILYYEYEEIYGTYEIRNNDGILKDDSEIVGLDVEQLEELCLNLICYIKELNCQIKKDELEKDFV